MGTSPYEAQDSPSKACMAQLPSYIPVDKISTIYSFLNDLLDKKQKNMLSASRFLVSAMKCQVPIAYIFLKSGQKSKVYTCNSIYRARSVQWNHCSNDRSRHSRVLSGERSNMHEKGQNARSRAGSGVMPNS